MSTSFQTVGVAFSQKKWTEKWLNFITFQNLGQYFPSLPHRFRGHTSSDLLLQKKIHIDEVSPTTVRQSDTFCKVNQNVFC